MGMLQTLLDDIWRTYRPGQEIRKTPTDSYVAAASAVQQWIVQPSSRTDEFLARSLFSSAERAIDAYLAGASA